MDWDNPSAGICLYGSCLPYGYAVLFFLTNAISRLIRAKENQRYSMTFSGLRNTADTAFLFSYRGNFSPPFPPPPGACHCNIGVWESSRRNITKLSQEGLGYWFPLFKLSHTPYTFSITTPKQEYFFNTKRFLLSISTSRTSSLFLISSTLSNCPAKMVLLIYITEISICFAYCIIWYMIHFVSFWLVLYENIITSKL